MPQEGPAAGLAFSPQKVSTEYLLNFQQLGAEYGQLRRCAGNEHHITRHLTTQMGIGLLPESRYDAWEKPPVLLNRVFWIQNLQAKDCVA